MKYVPRSMLGLAVGLVGATFFVVAILGAILTLSWQLPSFCLVGIFVCAVVVIPYESSYRAALRRSSRA